MLEKWFLEDVKNIVKSTERLVLIDEKQEANFLLEHLSSIKNINIFRVSNEIEELSRKYDIEKNYIDKKVIIISNIPLNNLKFLREYAETGECLNIKNLDRFIQQIVKEKANFDLEAFPEKIIALGKLSIGKGIEYWNRLKGKGNIFTEEEILAFLEAPENWFNSFDKEVKDLFVDFMSEFTEQSLSNKPSETIAQEIISTIFSNLLNKTKNSFLDNLYKKWIDSKQYEPVLHKYVKNYKLSELSDIWSVPLDHPFAEIDLRWLKELVNNIKNREWFDQKKNVLLKRAEQGISKTIGVKYWKDIHTLFSYNAGSLNHIKSLQEAVERYQEEFFEIDQAIRHLFTFFLNEKRILRPIQEYYRNIVQQFLEKWFSFFQTQYQENQTGLLKKTILNNKPPLAIIVGDAISYEVAREIHQKIKGSYSGEYRFSVDMVCGDFPSITDNNMSRLFGDPINIYENRGRREKRLQDEIKTKINFYDLNNISISHTITDYSIFYLADMDSISEKEGQNALKYYDTIIDNTCEKIDCLFRCGYKKIILVSDHGFVLTGILEEADKISLNVGDGKKFERYCLSKKKIRDTPEHVLEFKKPYKEYEYIYFSTTLNPFKTPGPYGFSHGGITPQELLIPFLKIEKYRKEINTLEVEIINKEELLSVIGDIYPVKLKTGSSKGNMFSRERRIIIVMVKDKKEFYQSDVISIREEEALSRDFSFKEHEEFEIVVLDEQTKIRLDHCHVKRNIVRDLGGLL